MQVLLLVRLVLVPLKGLLMDKKDDNVHEDLAHYRKVLSYLEANVPIQVLCLPKVVENALLADGCIRVYDMLNRDLTKVKGLGRNRLDLLTARLDEFLTVSI